MKQVELEGKRLKFSTPNDVTHWRIDTLFTKEPCTIEWLNSFKPGDVLYDVGANVGMYSIYAAVMRQTVVYAFEPEAKNYAVLNQNIELNKLDSLIKAYCLGISDFNGYSVLYLSNNITGEANHSVEKPVRFNETKMDVAFRQGCIVASLDDLVCDFPYPTHIKIDVDGIEPLIIGGAKEMLPQVQSILVEVNVNRKDHLAMVDYLMRAGFGYDEEQVAKAMREEGTFKGQAEYIFRRHA